MNADPHEIKSVRSVVNSDIKKLRSKESRNRPLYLPLDFVLVRVPLLPIESYLALDIHTCCGPLSMVPQDPKIRLALAIGSPDLLFALEDATTKEIMTANLRSKLERYLIRMSTRPTPFGLFAGVGLATWGEMTDLRLGVGKRNTRTRPDMNWLYNLVTTLEARLDIRQHLSLLANPLAFIHAGRVHLTESTAGTRGSANVSIRATGVVRRTLASARRPIPYRTLAAILIEQTPGATIEIVDAMLADLWQQSFLLTDLRPPLTKGNPAHYLLERLRAIPVATLNATQLERLLDAVEAWDRLTEDRAEIEYVKLERHAKAISAAVGNTSLQVDSALDLEGRSLTPAVGVEAARAAELLLRLTPWPYGPPNLSAYRAAFLAQYGQGREVALLELLDPQHGLGPPSPYGGWDGILPQRAARRAQALVDLAISAIRDARHSVELDLETLDCLQTWQFSPATVPRSLDIYAFVAAQTVEALDAGDFNFIVGPNLGANTAGRNLGRFVDLLGPNALRALKDFAKNDQQGLEGRICAELVYLPHDLHAANVIIRPNVQTHEIVLGVTAGVPEEQVIGLDELVVGVREDKFYLRWAARDVEICVCSGHMLNSLRAPAVCRFLTEIGRDGEAQLSPFDWGPASGFPFLPRVTVGRVVLSLAKWQLDAATRSRVFGQSSQASFGEALHHWRLKWRVPQYVLLSTGDNRLALDLEKPSHTEQLRDEIRRVPKSTSILLEEFYPGLNHAWLSGPDGHYMVELVVSLAQRRGSTKVLKSKTANTVKPVYITREVQDDHKIRRRPPGSEWLFVKLYVSSVFEDDLLAYHIRPFVNSLVASGSVEQWFFLRYSDPESHLRLRFCGEPSQLIGQVMPQICVWASKLMQDNLCHHFAFDTYDRELDRYGGVAGIKASEALFSADSQLVVDLLYARKEKQIRMDQTILAVLCVDTLLAGLGLDSDARLLWYLSVAHSRAEVGAEYRERKNVLRKALGLSYYLNAQFGGEFLVKAFERRNAKLAEVKERLSTLAKNNELNQDMNTLYGSYIHLHLNRLAGIDHSFERRILGLLARVHESILHAPVKPRFSIQALF